MSSPGCIQFLPSRFGHRTSLPFDSMAFLISDPLIDSYALLLYLNRTNLHSFVAMLKQGLDLSCVEFASTPSVSRSVKPEVKHCLSFPYLTLYPSHVFFDNCSTSVS